ncbi:MAG: sigma-54-dependent Fis family transcriptional regulator [Deltaproteobacteria bacterium]|nr:sigma-54-dependent Fis family transcriptional regulator [Deltaproteobacteria bacterium]
MAKTLFSWIGHADLNGMRDGGGGRGGPGAIARILEKRPGEFSRVVVLFDKEDLDRAGYKNWLEQNMAGAAEVECVLRKLKRPTDFDGIYNACKDAVGTAAEAERYYNLSSGTPAMATVWILLSRMMLPGTLLEASFEEGVKQVDFPFDLWAEYIAKRCAAERPSLKSLLTSIPETAKAFEDIVGKSGDVVRAVQLARVASQCSLPILLEGESGTGKELFGRAIHSASPRSMHKFQAVNCGALPAALVESLLFGHVKGAFNEAFETRAGAFQECHCGTLFLDEIGELPLEQQVKLNRAIGTGEVTKLGCQTVEKVDVRVVAATNRKLVQEVASGRFREDLFYRLCVLPIIIPPLRERGHDLVSLIDHFMKTIASAMPAQCPKSLAPTALAQLVKYPWPGNVRELMNVLNRLFIWTPADTITEQDVIETLKQNAFSARDDILNRPLGKDTSDLNGLIERVDRHYIERALDETHGNAAQAARLLNLGNGTTLTDRAKAVGLHISDFRKKERSY